jgi:hypothetical protein
MTTVANRRLLVVGFVVALALLILGVQLVRSWENGDPPTSITVWGLVGGEKTSFLDDGAVEEVLLERYGITVDHVRTGSIEMVQEDAPGEDFLWPGTQVSLDIYRQRQGPMEQSEEVFGSPLVLYSWAPVVDALVGAGVAAQDSRGYYSVDMERLLALIQSDTPWSSLGLPELSGNVLVHCTDPTRSSSGNMYVALIATALNGGRAVDDASIAGVLPELEQFHGRQGFLPSSSGDLFELFLRSGMRIHPIIAGYENQFVEYALLAEPFENLPTQDVRILYPRQTMWATHPLIAITPNGVRLLEALKDEEIQRLAWERHGFRSRLAEVENNPVVLEVAGVPATIDSVVPMPSQSVMGRIMAALADPPPAGPATPAEARAVLPTRESGSWGRRARPRPRPATGRRRPAPGRWRRRGGCGARCARRPRSPGQRWDRGRAGRGRGGRHRPRGS